MDLNDKVALVTGASRGIGRAIALRLARAGASVVVNYHVSEDAARGVVAEIEAMERRAVAVQADVSRPEEVKALFAQASEAFDGVDILVNNAGILRDNLLMRMSEEEWDEVMDTNLRSAFLCTREAIRLMMRRRWGRVVNISSAIAKKGNIGQSNYAASKAAMLGFTVAMAREVASRNITVNSVLPGYIETEIVAEISQKVKDVILTHIPMERFGTPEEVCGLVAFLCTDEARYITGQGMFVDGGLSL